jgi:hypothetical protein
MTIPKSIIRLSAGIIIGIVASLFITKKFQLQIQIPKTALWHDVYVPMGDAVSRSPRRRVTFREFRTSAFHEDRNHISDSRNHNDHCLTASAFTFPTEFA